MLEFRNRFGRFLHSASISLLNQGDESSIDAILILVSLQVVTEWQWLNLPVDPILPDVSSRLRGFPVILSRFPFRSVLIVQ